jgi:hypothetical protein
LLPPSNKYLINILVAWPYYANEIGKIISENNVRFVLDSGAFTAWKAGKSYQVEQYAEFLNSLEYKPWKYFALDVIGDPKATLKNFDKMLEMGFNPIPIFTRGDDLKMLDYYYKYSDVVAIGGLVGTKKNKGFVKGIMEHIGNRKVHWLGFTSLDYIRYFKPYMCDSSSWIMPVKYGVMVLYDAKGRFLKLTKEDIKSRPSQQIIDLLTRYEEKVEDLKDPKNWTNSGKGIRLIERLMFKSHTLCQYDICKAFNVKYFLATSHVWQIKMLLEGNKFWLDKGVIHE